jgi:hypothetical protein
MLKMTQESIIVAAQLALHSLNIVFALLPRSILNVLVQLSLVEDYLATALRYICSRYIMLLFFDYLTCCVVAFDWSLLNQCNV